MGREEHDMSKILIVDDNEANREILRMRLEKLGHDVIDAENGEQGLLRADAECPDLIFLDVMMPGKDGWQICQALKQNLKTQKTPVIMLTALSEATAELRAQHSEPDDFMGKPWAPNDLKAILTKWLVAA
jgi:CheY-like chemotaxis protein